MNSDFALDSKNERIKDILRRLDKTNKFSTSQLIIIREELER